MAGNRLQGDGTVLDGARQRATDVHRPAGSQHAVATDQAPGGPNPDKAAVVGGVADGAPRIFPQRGGTEKGRRSRARATAGGARIAPEIPRVVRRAVGMAHAVAGS